MSCIPSQSTIKLVMKYTKTTYELRKELRDMRLSGNPRPESISPGDYLILKLSPRARAVVRYVLEGYSQREAAQVFDYSKSRISIIMSHTETLEMIEVSKKAMDYVFQGMMEKKLNPEKSS